MFSGPLQICDIDNATYDLLLKLGVYSSQRQISNRVYGKPRII